MVGKIDLAKLDPATRARVQRALSGKRDTVLSLRFSAAKIAAWKKAAESGDEFFTDWVERALDAACGR